jgi:hypothetical protein
MATTETLDRLFLEWSQFTAAKTRREIELENTISDALHHLRDATPRNGPVIKAISILTNGLNSK